MIALPQFVMLLVLCCAVAAFRLQIGAGDRKDEPCNCWLLMISSSLLAPILKGCKLLLLVFLCLCLSFNPFRSLQGLYFLVDFFSEEVLIIIFIVFFP
jgi:hypothetical protein